MDSEEQTCGGCGKPSLVVILTPHGSYCLLCYELKYPGPAPSLSPQRLPPAARPPVPPRRKPTPLTVRGCRAIGFEGIPGSGVRTQRDLFALALARSGRSFSLVDGPEEAEPSEDAVALLARPFSLRPGEPPRDLPPIVVLLQISDADARQRLVDEGQGRETIAARYDAEALRSALEETVDDAPDKTFLIRENGALPAQELHERIWSRCIRALPSAEDLL